MAFWDIQFRHIVDVDGQLLAIDADVIGTASLLAKAGQPVDRALWLVRADERFLMEPRRLVRLSQDEVLFFETEELVQNRSYFRLAA